MFDLQTFTLIHVLISIAALLTGIPLLIAFARGHARPALATGTGDRHHRAAVAHQRHRLRLSVHPVPALAPVRRDLARTAGHHVLGTLAGGAGRRVAQGLRHHLGDRRVSRCVRVRGAGLPEGPRLHALAPTQESPGFAVAQGVLLLVFVGLGYASVRGIGRTAPASR